MKSCWFLAWAVSASSCAHPAQPAATSATCPCAATRESTKRTEDAEKSSEAPAISAAAQPSAASNRDALRVAALGYDPKLAAAMLSTAAGVVVGRSLSCEREKPVDSVTHTCGAKSQAAVRPLLPGLRAMLDMALRHPDEGGVECTGSAPVRCTVAAHGECQSLYELYFVDDELVAILERDDWQSAEEYRQAFDARVASAMRDAECP